MIKYAHVHVLEDYLAAEDGLQDVINSMDRCRTRTLMKLLGEAATLLGPKIAEAKLEMAGKAVVGEG